MRAWAVDDDLWLRRTAIICQLAPQGRHRPSTCSPGAGGEPRGQPARPGVLRPQGASAGRCGSTPASDPDWVRAFVAEHEDAAVRAVAARGAQAPVRARVGRWTPPRRCATSSPRSTTRWDSWRSDPTTRARSRSASGSARAPRWRSTGSPRSPCTTSSRSPAPTSSGRWPSSRTAATEPATSCGEPIGEGRLEALPWAVLCVDDAGRR